MTKYDMAPVTHISAIWNTFIVLFWGDMYGKCKKKIISQGFRTLRIQ